MDAEAVRTIHDDDQRQMRAGAFGRDVAAFYRSLIDGKVPDGVAALLTADFQNDWLCAHCDSLGRMSIVFDGEGHGDNRYLPPGDDV